MRTVRALIPVTMAIGLLMSVPPAVGADTASPGTRPTSNAPRPLEASSTSADSSSDAASAEEALTYWTDERIANAEPLDAVATGEPPAGGTPAAPTGPEGDTEAAPPTVTSKAAEYTETDTVGKLFFHSPSAKKDYECTAAAINSESKRMIITAAHCLHETAVDGKKRKWMEKIVYVPAYRDGRRPVGTWPVKSMTVYKAFSETDDLAYDYGFATTYQVKGQNLVDVTGGNGFSWNYGIYQRVLVWGYPDNRANSERQWWCTDETDEAPYPDMLQVRCNFTGGASGGPWLRNYNDATGLGHINSVTSTLMVGSNLGPYFDDSTKSLKDSQGSKV